MSKAHSQKKTKNFHITSVTLETDSDSCKSDNDSFKLCERCNNGFSKAYYEELKNKTSKFPYTTTNSSRKKLSKKKITKLENIKLKFIEDDNHNQKNKKKKGNIYGIDQSLVCHTCNFLPENPTICYKCNTLFCRQCLENYVKEKERCPKCLKLITIAALQNINLKNIYSKYKVKCPYNGCQEFLDLNQLIEHSKECVYKNVKSKNDVKHFNKFVILSFEDDPYTKLYYGDYCVRKNKSDIDCQKYSSVLNYDEFVESFNGWVKGKINGEKCLNDVKKKINESNSKINKDLLDVAKLTKDTNEVIKNMLKH